MKGKLLGLSLLFLFLFVVANANAGTYNATCDYNSTWNINGSTFLQEISIASQDNIPSGIFLKPDGTSIWLVGRQNKGIYQYNFGTAYNISTISYINFVNSSSYDGAPTGVFFKPDGTRMYILSAQADTVDEWVLSSAWNTSTASYVQEISIGAKEIDASGISFKPDGTIMYIIGYNGDTIDQWHLSTAWNVTTASYVQEISISAKDNTPTDIYIKEDGTTLYFIGYQNKKIYEYSFGTAWNITTISYVRDFYVGGKEAGTQGLFIDSNGVNVYVTGDTGDKIYQYYMNYTLNCTDPTPTDLIEIISPLAQNYTTQNVMINISNKTSMTNIDRIWYNWNGTNVTYTTPISTTFPAGEHTLQAWANNTAGTEHNVNVTFWVYTPPSESDITQPEDLVFGYYTLTWTESIVDYGSIDYYNVSFFGDTEYEVYSGALLTTLWNTTEIPNQEGYLQMEVCSDVGLCNVTTTTNFTINNFNVTLVEPSGNGTFVGDTYFEIVRDGTDDIWCDLYGDSDVLASKILYSGDNNWNGTTSLISTETEIYVECYIVGYSSVITTQAIDFEINNTIYTLDYERDLIGYGNVYTTPQTLFYDHNGNLNLLFFSLNGGDEYLNIIRVNGSDIVKEYSTALPRSMNYINVFLEPAQTTIMLIDVDGQGLQWVNLTDTNITVDAQAFADFVIDDRDDMLEPTQIINTHGQVGVIGGYFLVPVPINETAFSIYKKVVGSNALTDTTKVLRGYSISTSLKAGDFSEWYIGGGNATNTSYFNLETYDGSNYAIVYSSNVSAQYFINSTYKSKVRLTESHVIITQMAEATQPLLIFDLVSVTSKYSTNYKVEIISPILYISDSLFGFFASSDYVYETFTTNGSFTVPAGVTKVDVLVVGGGGGGGAGDHTDATERGGGGGAGGLVLVTDYSVIPTAIMPVVVGNGGAGGTWNGSQPTNAVNGASSTFGSLTALGGGAGGTGDAYGNYRTGIAGGSGGGGARDSTTYYNGGAGSQPSQAGLSGTYGFGNAGGKGSGVVGYAGSGGGAGGSGSSTGYGGSGMFVWGNIYGLGGHTYTSVATKSANTGNGGDGNVAYNGTAGASGIVIVRYLASGNQHVICYDNSTSINCTWYDQNDYVFAVPIDDYPLSAQYIDNDGVSKVTFGKVKSGVPYTFIYNENEYDAKFQCLDEMAEHNLAFNFSITNSNLSTYYVIDSNILGYIIPSSLLGVGLKNIETTCNTSVARGYFLGLDDNYLMDFYGLNESKGLYYTINIVNAFGNPVQGVYLTAQRFSPSKTAFATIQQEVTDTNGDAIFFLEPTIPYKLLVIQEGVTIATLSFVPGSSANIELALGSTANPVPFTDGDLVFDDVTFGVTPYVSFFTEDLNITYTVSSAESKLDDVGMIITKKNASGTYTVYNNSLNSPAGASFNYTFNSTGSYVVTYYFDHEDYDIYQNVLLYQYGRNSSMSLISEGLLDVGFSGWAYYLFAVVISGLVIGFMSRYSWEGASIMGLLILWAFSIFAPAGMYITEFALADGGVWYIGFIEVTTLTTIVVLALLYRRSTV